jgi:hypothetical protein
MRVTAAALWDEGSTFRSEPHEVRRPPVTRVLQAVTCREEDGDRGLKKEAQRERAGQPSGEIGDETIEILFHAEVLLTTP